MPHRHPDPVALPPAFITAPASTTTVPRSPRYRLFPDIVDVDRTTEATP
jgi:hypothetical protein